MKRLLLGVILLATAACGQKPDTIGERASARLAPQVRQTRAAAAGGDTAGVAAQLAALRRSVADLRQRHELSDGGAARVLGAASEVEGNLPAVPATAVTVTTTTTGSPGTSPLPTVYGGHEKHGGGKKGD